MLQEKVQALQEDWEKPLSYCGAFSPETGAGWLSQDSLQFQPKVDALTKHVHSSDWIKSCGLCCKVKCPWWPWGRGRGYKNAVPHQWGCRVVEKWAGKWGQYLWLGHPQCKSPDISEVGGPGDLVLLMKCEWNWRMSLLGGNFRSQGLSCQSPVPQVNKVSFSLDSWGMTMSRSCPHSHADHEIWGLFVKAAWPKLSWRYGRGAWISHVEGRQRDVSVFSGLCVSCREGLEGKDLRRQRPLSGAQTASSWPWLSGFWDGDILTFPSERNRPHLCRLASGAH